MGLMNEEPYVVLPGRIVLLRMGESGVYAHVDNVVKDTAAKNRLGWLVTLSVLIYGLPVQTLLINDEHAKGEAFTLDGKFMQFCSVDFSTAPIEESIKEIKPYTNLRFIKGGKYAG